MSYSMRDLMWLMLSSVLLATIVLQSRQLQTQRTELFKEVSLKDRQVRSALAEIAWCRRQLDEAIENQDWPQSKDRLHAPSNP